MGAIAEKDRSVQEQQPGPTVLVEWVEGDRGTPVARAWNRCGDHLGTGRLFCAGRNVEHVQAVHMCPLDCFDVASTYIVPVVGSITGVLVMPIWGIRSLQAAPISLCCSPLFRPTSHRVPRQSD